MDMKPPEWHEVRRMDHLSSDPLTAIYAIRDKDPSWAIRRRATHLISLGQYQLALNDADRVRERDDENPKWQGSIAGHALLGLGDYA